MAGKSNKIDDVKRPDKVAPTPTSRPILVTHRPMITADPMMAPTPSSDEPPKPVEPVTRTAKTIKPLTAPVVAADTSTAKPASGAAKAETSDTPVGKQSVDPIEAAANAAAAAIDVKAAEVAADDAPKAKDDAATNVVDSTTDKTDAKESPSPASDALAEAILESQDGPAPDTAKDAREPEEVKQGETPAEPVPSAATEAVDTEAVDTEAEADTNAEAETKTEPEAKTEAEPETEAETESEAPTPAATITEPSELTVENAGPSTPEATPTPTTPDTPAEIPATESAPGDLGGMQPERDSEAELSAEQAAVIEAKVAREQEIEQLIASGKYFVPINAAHRKRSHRLIAISCLVLLLVVLIALDVALDMELLKLDVNLPHTNFF